MTGEGEEGAGTAGVSLGVMYYLPFSVSAYVAARPEIERNILQKGW
jgi:hypothetical protein